MIAAPNQPVADNDDASAGERLLKLKDVMQRTCLGSSTIYRKIAAGTFPQAKALGSGTVRWKEREINAWINALPDNDTGHDNRQQGQK